MINPNNNNNPRNNLTATLLIIYLLLLLWILLFKLGVRFSYMETRSVNFIPFGRPQLSNGKTNFSEIILNVLVFVPLGVYAGVLFKRWNFGRQALFFFLVSFSIEALQFIMRAGAFDITDIITNISGGIIGLLLFLVIERLFKNSVRSQKFINIIATTATFVMIALLLMLKLNMLPVRYQ